MAKVFVDLDTVKGIYVKGDICLFGILFLILVIWLLRDIRRNDILKPEYLAHCKVINLLLIVNLNFSNALTFVFVARNYGTINPI